jgi:hypothetical protein
MKLTHCLTVALLLSFAAAAGSTTIYKSVDGQGRVTFSDQPPDRGEVVDILEYSEPQPRPPALDLQRIEAMREVTDRMAADRREREASRARARAARQSRDSIPAYNGDYDSSGDRYEDYYPYRRYHSGFNPVRVIHKPPGHRRPGFRPHHPHPPIARPHPRPPAHTGRAAGFNQYPANLIRRHYTSAARRVFYNQPYPGR